MHQRAELLQEMRALAWKWFIRLEERGKDVNGFPSVFVRLLGRAVNSGRRVTGLAKAKDVLNSVTQKRYGFHVETLDSASVRTSHDELCSMACGQRRHDEFEERLRDNTITPILDQVQFRIDWPAWLATLTSRERRLIRAMARDERTRDLSREFDVSPPRISQLRRQFHEGWTRYCGDAVAV